MTEHPESPEQLTKIASSREPRQVKRFLLSKALESATGAQIEDIAFLSAVALVSEVCKAANLRRAVCPGRQRRLTESQRARWPEGCLRPAIRPASLTSEARSAHALKASTRLTNKRVSPSSVLGEARR